MLSKLQSFEQDRQRFVIDAINAWWIVGTPVGGCLSMVLVCQIPFTLSFGRYKQHTTSWKAQSCRFAKASANSRQARCGSQNYGNGERGRIRLRSHRRLS